MPKTNEELRVVRIIVTKEKHGERYINAGTTKEDLEKAAAFLLKSRIEDGYWYYDDEPVQQPTDIGEIYDNLHRDTSLTDAKKALKDGKAWRFLQLRSNYEYEYVDLDTVENP